MPGGFLNHRATPAILFTAGLAAIGLALLAQALGGRIDPAPPSTATTAAATSSPAVGSPTARPGTSATASGAAARSYATRIRISSLGIDLPITSQARGYPLCDVALYIRDLGQPGEARATYLYAHARAGMFGPIYDLAHAGEQARLIGLVVEVWTDDDRLHTYRVTEVRLHQTTLDDALRATTEQLWLQTSEGPPGTLGETQLVALPVSLTAADPADAHPAASPRVCG